MARIETTNGEGVPFYSKIPRQVLASTELPAISKMLFADIYTLSSIGKRGYAYKRDEKYSELLTFKGKPFTVKNISLHLRNLEEFGLIKRITTQKSHKVRERKIFVTKQFEQYISFPQYVLNYGYFNSASTILVYIELYGLAHLPNDAEGYTWATNKEIAHNTGLSVRTVQRCISELQEKKFIYEIQIMEDGQRFIFLEDEEYFESL